MANGKEKTALVLKSLGGFFYLDTGDEKPLECRGTGSLKQKGISPLVGDMVEYTSKPYGDGGMVTKIMPRRNSFIRPPVANVETFLVVASLKSPNISYSVIDKFLAVVEKNKAEAILIITKRDLIKEEKAKEVLEIYKDLYPCLLIGENSDENIEELIKLIGNKKIAVAGPSGVGKSTLINRLIPRLDLETGNISEKTGRGRHTTRHTEIYKSNKGFSIFDTPGFTSLQLIGIEENSLGNLYPEIRKYSSKCKFKDCSHIHEPECQVKEALNQGKIKESRYHSYLEHMKELKGEFK